MRVSVFYFSGTGNTKWAVDEISKCFKEKGHECLVYAIENTVPDLCEIVNDSDLIGFAFPIYGANIPNIMARFLKELEQICVGSSSKPAFIVTTSGFIDGYGPIAANRIIKKCGFKLLSYIDIKLSNDVSTPSVKTNIRSGESLKKRLEKSKLVINKTVDHLLSKSRYVRNIGPYLIPGLIIRKATEKGQKNCYLSLSVDKDRCRKCMRCVNNCPTKSIVYKDDNFSFLPSCTACMRCYNFCPANAVYQYGKYADPQIYKRYKGPQAYD